MKVKLDFTPGTQVEAVTDDEGNIISVSIEPFFPSRRGVAIVAHGSSVSRSDAVLYQGILTVSGYKGTVSLRNRNESATPYVDMSAEERAVANRKPDEEDEEDGGTSRSKRS